MTIAVIEEETTVPSVSAVTWPAIVAGALVAIAASLILFSLGSGLGFAAASPWGDVEAETAEKITVAAAIWLIVVQWIASAGGGYLAGRLRTRWHATHTHEVFFRDTAHGLLAWAFATVVVAVFTAAVATSTTGGAVAAASNAPNFAYDADALYRTPSGDESALTAARAEAIRLLGAATVRGGLDAGDHDYLVASVAARAGVTPAEAGQRVDIVVARERQAVADATAAADRARQAADAAGFMTALAMVVGAFIASLAGALGGAERDKHP